MTAPDGVRAVVAAVLDDSANPATAINRIGEVCVELLPVDGASISLMIGTAHRQVLFVSDDVMERVEALQYSLAEGPCFEACDTRGPVLVPDLPNASGVSWPAFAEGMIGHPVGAIFAFPLQNGAINVGAVDFYRREPGWLSPAEVTVALEVVDIVMLALLALQAGPGDGEWWAALPYERAQVHQATGMLIAALGLTAEQALARLRGHAFATGRLVDEVARDIVGRRLSPVELDR